MLYAQETYRNASENYIIGESDVQETFTENVGELYRSCRAEYGRCTGRVYVDGRVEPRAIGWVFLKRVQYDDSPETYLQEVWVTVHKQTPTVITTNLYAELS